MTKGVISSDIKEILTELNDILGIENLSLYILNNFYYKESYDKNCEKLNLIHHAIHEIIKNNKTNISDFDEDITIISRCKRRI